MLLLVVLVVAASTGLAGVLGRAPEPGQVAEHAADAPPTTAAGTAPVLEKPSPAALPERATRRPAAPRVEFPDWSGPSLLVVDGTTGRPVAGATVAVLDHPGRRGRDLVEETEQHGALRRTGPDGRIRLPTPGRRFATFSVAGSAPGRFGHAVVRTVDHGNPTLVLQPDETLRVHVVSASREPVQGVGIALQEGLRDFGWMSPRGFTDERGTWVLRHLQSASNIGDGAFTVLLCIATNPVVVAHVPDRPVAVEPVVLRLPPTGSVSVRALDHEGVPLRSELDLELEYDLPKHPVHGHLVQSVHKHLEPGAETLEFPHVGLGMTLYPTLYLPSQDRDPLSVDGEPFRTPPRSGERLHVQVRLPEGITLIRGAVLDTDGHPLPPRKVLAWRETAEGYSGSIGLPVLGEGRIEWFLRLSPETLPEAVVVRTMKAEEGMAVRVPVANLTPGTTHDFGEVRLQTVTERVRGRVSDEEGRPVADARVAAAAPGRPTPWSTVSDAEGNFELRMLPDASPDVLSVSHRDYVPREIERPADEMEVVLLRPRSGTFESRPRGRKPFWLSHGALRFELVPRRVAEAPESGLAPGLYDYVVELDGYPSPVLTIPGIEIGPGENRDPRVDGLRMERLVHRYRLFAMDEHGKRVGLRGDAHVSRGPDKLTVAWRFGALEVIAPGPEIHVSFFDSRGEPREMTLRPGDHKVRMGR